MPTRASPRPSSPPGLRRTAAARRGFRRAPSLVFFCVWAPPPLFFRCSRCCCRARDGTKAPRPWGFATLCCAAGFVLGVMEKSGEMLGGEWGDASRCLFVRARGSAARAATLSASPAGGQRESRRRRRPLVSLPPPQAPRYLHTEPKRARDDRVKPRDLFLSPIHFLDWCVTRCQRSRGRKQSESFQEKQLFFLRALVAIRLRRRRARAILGAQDDCILLFPARLDWLDI